MLARIQLDLKSQPAVFACFKASAEALLTAVFQRIIAAKEEGRLLPPYDASAARLSSALVGAVQASVLAFGLDEAAFASAIAGALASAAAGLEEVESDAEDEGAAREGGDLDGEVHLGHATEERTSTLWGFAGATAASAYNSVGETVEGAAAAYVDTIMNPVGTITGAFRKLGVVSAFQSVFGEQVDKSDAGLEAAFGTVDADASGRISSDESTSPAQPHTLVPLQRTCSSAIFALTLAGRVRSARVHHGGVRYWARGHGP